MESQISCNWQRSLARMPFSPRAAVFNICRNDDEGSPGKSGRGNQSWLRVDKGREVC